MRLVKCLLAVAFVVGCASAEERQKRQAGYGGSYGGGQAQYRPQQQAPPQQQQQAAYAPPQQYGGQQVQHYPAQQPRPVRQHASQAAPEEEEKEQGPHPLQLLLEKSKFECGSKTDGYYADSDVGCQAFHYCVSGQKHSMMCPEGTVFHQVHLNCVPNDQDICSKANKFFFVNDYLNKPLDQRGPNNTVQYHQRYYPDNYAVGDPFIPPQESQKDHRGEPPAATYGLGPAYREQAPAPQQAYQQPAPRPQRPAPAAYAPQPQQVYAAQPRPVAYAPQQPAAAPRPQAQQVAYGYGAPQEQAYQQQALQAQRAYQQQQQYAAAPQQQLYAQQAQQQQQRQRYQ